MKKKPNIVIASKPASSGKKRLISPNHLGRLAVDSLITSPVKSEPKEIKEDTKVRAGTRAFISILIHAKTCRFVNIKAFEIDVFVSTIFT